MPIQKHSKRLICVFKGQITLGSSCSLHLRWNQGNCSGENSLLSSFALHLWVFCICEPHWGYSASCWHFSSACIFDFYIFLQAWMETSSQGHLPFLRSTKWGRWLVMATLLLWRSAWNGEPGNSSVLLFIVLHKALCINTISQKMRWKWRAVAKICTDIRRNRHSRASCVFF